MSTIYAEPTPYFLELEALTDGVPRVRATIYNVPGTVDARLERLCEGATNTVPGARRLTVSDAAVITDWAAPLNRTIVYSVIVAGERVSTASITLPSDRAWVQDPLNPVGAMPIRYASQPSMDGELTFTDTVMRGFEYPNDSTKMFVVGDEHPRAFGGQRSAATGVNLSVYSWDEAGHEQFKTLKRTPILLIRLAKRGPLPPVAYLLAQIGEDPLDQHLGGWFTRWSVSGDLVAAVLQAAITGSVTYEQVQELLGGYTYAEVQAVAAGTTYLDWQKNPLIFTSL